MKEFSGLRLHDHFVTREWLLQPGPNFPSADFSAFERQVLAFCQQWLSGRETFEVRTSGSTGAPRIIRISRQQMIASAGMTATALHLQPGDRALICLSPSHIAGLMMLVRGMTVPLQMAVVEPAANPFSFFIKKNELPRFDFTALVPLQLEAILATEAAVRQRLNEMKAVLVGGAPVSPRLQKQLQDVAAPVFQTFGMTETVSHIALRRLNDAAASDNYQALPGVQIGQDERGCLTVRAAVTAGKRIVTNDRVQLLGPDRFLWLGRLDHMINSGGMKVQPEKVEQALAEVLTEMNAVGECLICGLPDEKLGEAVTAVFQGQPFEMNVEQGLRRALARKLPKHEIPRRFCFVNSFPRTRSGKIDRRRCRELLMQAG